MRGQTSLNPLIDKGFHLSTDLYISSIFMYNPCIIYYTDFLRPGFQTISKISLFWATAGLASGLCRRRHRLTQKLLATGPDGHGRCSVLGQVDE